MADSAELYKLCKDCTKRRKECKDQGATLCAYLVWCYMFESKARLKKQKIAMAQKELKIKQEIKERAEKICAESRKPLTTP